MNFKWIFFALAISVLFHLGIIFFFGNLHLSLPSFDFIHAYVFESKKKVREAPKKEEVKTPNEELKKEEVLDKDQELDEKTQTPKEQKPEEKTASVNTQPKQDTAELKETNNQVPSIMSNIAKFINERMKFDIYWMGIYAGYAIMKVTGTEEEIKIISEVHSAPFISNFYYVNDRAESVIFMGRPKSFQIKQIEGKYRGHKETQFNYEVGEITFINHIKNKVTVHKGIDRLFMDVLTGFYFVRTQSIKPEQSVFVEIFDSDKFGTVEVKALKEEVIETEIMKEVNSIMIKPELATEGLFKRKGDILIWLSNDERKIPLRVETKVSVGKVVAELKEYKKD